MIIPAIDIINGKCVRLNQGNYNKMIIYHNNPVDVAKKISRFRFQIFTLS